MTKIAFVFLLLTALLVGCGGEEPGVLAAETPETAVLGAPETPVQGIQAIIDLYKAKNFDALIRTRYAEIDKAKNEEQIQSLIDRFKSRFKDAKKLKQAIETYTAVLKIVPEISADGKTATFKIKKGFVKLSKMPNGKWGFHL